MKERPILFSGEMVRAILDGTKTQTRRVVKPQPTSNPEPLEGVPGVWIKYRFGPVEENDMFRCPYGAPGDRLWVREAWRALHSEADICYRADDATKHMPRWASRIDLELTDVRVERVQEISEEDALAEGVGPIGPSGIRWPNFARLWDEINGKRPGCSWADNPWVWVVSFRRMP